MKLEILYKDEYIVAINKPYGYFVHRTKFDANSEMIIMPILRDQLGQFVYPAHRLDRKTSGVLLFALNKEVLIDLNNQFMNREVDKKYMSIVRGWMPDSGDIDYDLTNEDGKVQRALTNYRLLEKTEIPISSGRYDTSRYSLAELTPITGRMHQLRKHMDHIFHPIVGDRPYGCNKQNRFFLKQFNYSEMLLHAKYLKFTHPITGVSMELQAPFLDEFSRVAGALGFKSL